MNRPIDDRARVARHDPYAYQNQRYAQVERRATIYPVEEDQRHYYPAPQYSRWSPQERIQLAAMLIGFLVFLVIVLLIVFAYITAPPAPIVHHSNPSCLFWCD